jgi:hypothetical protein
MAKINFETLEEGKVIPEVWVVTCGRVEYKKGFKKLNHGIYDLNNSDWGIATHLDSFFTSELEALEAALDYKLKELEELNDRIKELTND